MQRPTLLVVDDDDDIRETLSAVLREEGFVVVTAANGQEALERLEESATPRVVLLDMMMPVKSGWQVLAHLDETPSLASRVRVVVITAASPDKLRAIQAGCRAS